MTELLYRIPTSLAQSQRSNSIGARSEHGNDAIDSSSFAHWIIDQMMRAPEGTNRSIQINLAEFVGSLNLEEYCD